MIVLLALLLSLNASGAQRTIFVPVVRGHDKLSFNSTAIAEKDLRRWMQLSPNVSDSNDYSAPESLELCVEKQNEYKECGTRDLRAKNFIYNANENLEKIRGRIRKLDEGSYPAELKSVVTYFKRIQQTELFFQSHLLQFFQDWQTVDLAAPFEGIDPGQACSAQIEMIKAAPDTETAYRRTQGWRNCVNRLLRKQTGEYPKTAWEVFLGKRAIREQLIEDDPGD